MNNEIETRFTRDYGVQASHRTSTHGVRWHSPRPCHRHVQGGRCRFARCRAASGSGRPRPHQGRQSATDGPLNVNFITILANQAQIRTCIDESVSVVSFHWGHPPQNFVARLHDAGIKVWEQVGSVDAAKEAVDSGIDLIIAQGSEAGGHNYGSLPTFVLVPSILEAVAPTPVLAAGGIATGRQLAAALVLGADGVSIGTRFVASEEAFAHAEYKRCLVEAAGTQTRLSVRLWPRHAALQSHASVGRGTRSRRSRAVRTAHPKTSSHNRSSAR